MAGDLLEVVRPAYFWCPPYSFTAGDEVAGLCTDVGFAPDANQSQALDVVFAEDSRGIPAAFDVVVIGARQNIKTGLMKQCSIGWLWLLKVPRVLYTAHDWNPACADMFRDMKNLVEGSSLLSRRVRRIYEGNGEESIEFMSGQQMLFRTRTKAGGRAAAFDKVIWDEGFALQEAHVGSITPTQATRPHAQNLTGSSAGHANSEVLWDLRDRGRAGAIDPEQGDPYLAYIEYCAPDPVDACELGEDCDHGRRTPGCGCDNPELWPLANPAVAAGRITIEYIAKERRKMPPAEFARERMGWWDSPLESGGERPLSFERWQELTDWYDEADEAYAAPPARMPFFAIDGDVNLTRTSIGAAGWRDDDRIHLEHVQTELGYDWVIRELPGGKFAGRAIDLERDHGPATWVIDGGGPCKHLIEPLQNAGLNVLVLDTSDVVEACTQLVTGVNTPHDETYVHGPDGDLEAAVQAARKRMVGERGFTIGRRASARAKTGVVVSPLVAVMFAAFVCRQREPDYDLLDSFG